MKNSIIQFFLSLILGIGTIFVISPLLLIWWVSDYDRYLWIISGPYPYSTFGSAPYMLWLYTKLILIGVILITLYLFGKKKFSSITKSPLPTLQKFLIWPMVAVLIIVTYGFLARANNWWPHIGSSRSDINVLSEDVMDSSGWLTYDIPSRGVEMKYPPTISNNEFRVTIIDRPFKDIMVPATAQSFQTRMGYEARSFQEWNGPDDNCNAPTTVFVAAPTYNFVVKIEGKAAYPTCSLILLGTGTVFDIVDTLKFKDLEI